MKNWCLRTKVLFGIIGIVLLTGLSLAILVRIALTQTLHNELIKRGVFMTEHVAEMSEKPILTEDFEALLMLTYDYKRSDEDIEYIFVLDEYDNILAHTFKEGFPIELKEANRIGSGQKYSSQTISTEKGSVHDNAVPIMKGEIGVVHLGLSEESIKRAIAGIGCLCTGSWCGSGARN